MKSDQYLEDTYHTGLISKQVTQEIVAELLAYRWSFAMHGTPPSPEEKDDPWRIVGREVKTEFVYYACQVEHHSGCPSQISKVECACHCHQPGSSLFDAAEEKS